MADTVSAFVRSKIMSKVPQRHTKPERIVRSLLHKLGYRFRLHRKDLPGRPDIVLARHKTVIFVHGCFWHQHTGCKYARRPTSNTEYWEHKLDENIKRDRRNIANLKQLGWRVLIIWQCETKTINQLNSKIKKYFT